MGVGGMSMYVSGNPMSKAELARRLAEGERPGYWQPGPFGGNEPRNGVVYAEGPYGINPKTGRERPHSWYAKLRVQDGVVVEVLKN